MTNADFEQVTEQLGLLGQLASGLDLDAYLTAIDRCESIGALMDPTSWLRAQNVGGADALRQLKDLAVAAKRLAGAHKALVDGAAERVEKYGRERIVEVIDDSARSEAALRAADDVLFFGRRLDYVRPDETGRRVHCATGGMMASVLFGFRVSVAPLARLGFHVSLGRAASR
jgi:hypothetical protein